MPAGLDFTSHMRRLCADLTARLPELGHIDMTRVAVRWCQARRGGRHGVQASLTPLRFAGGALETLRGTRRWTIQRLFDASGQEMLYLLSFYLPRFLDHHLEEKLATVCHELWHIGPAFDGDLRRHRGRCFAHGRSQDEYHAAMRQLADRWVQSTPPAELYEFLRYNYRELRVRYGSIFGARSPLPSCFPRRVLFRSTSWNHERSDDATWPMWSGGPFALSIHVMPTNHSCYEQLACDLRALVEGESHLLANSANCAALLYHGLAEVNWAGFYLLEREELVLGPFQGRPACTRIPLGRGVCGTAALRWKTVLVPDVHQFPGHIACDTASNAEIVVPLVVGDRLLGVLDLDSPRVGRFDADDQDGLEQLVAILLAGSTT